MEQLLKSRIKTKKDTQANWESANPILKDGEEILVVCSDGKTRRKVGDGTSSYSSLPYADYGLVPIERTVNGKALSSDITLSASDVGASSSSHTHDDYIKVGEAIFPNHSFYGRKFYNSKTDNAFCALNKRATVTATRYNADGSVNYVYSSTHNSIAALFDGGYEGGPVNCAAGQSIKITIDLNDNEYIMYPYGYIYVSFFYGAEPASVTCRQRSGYYGQDETWFTMATTKLNNQLYSCSNPQAVPWARGWEITITSTDSKSVYVTEIEMFNNRTGYDAVLVKNKAQTLYYPLTAPEFVGKLTGTADSATKSSQDENGNVIHNTYATKTELQDSIDSHLDIERILKDGLTNGEKTFSEDKTVITTVDSSGLTLVKTFTNSFMTSTTVLTNSSGTVLGTMVRELSSDGSTVNTTVTY